MFKIAKFLKVSKDRYLTDASETLGVEGAAIAYEDVKLPARATQGSAGYDFYLPHAISIAPGETVKIATAVRAIIAEGWVLMLYPRSGLGYKFRVMLNNTTGIIDSDYSGSDNEGHIFVKLYNGGDKVLSLDKGDAFVQGVFLPYGITEDDNAVAIRNGGFGSTSGLV